MRFLLVDEKCLGSFSNDLEHQKTKIKFFLDLASDTPNLEDPFTKLMYRLKDSGTRVVADPDKVRFFANKSITHYELLKAEISLPFTIIIRSWDPARRLTDTEKEKLGIPFVVKPALGYAQKGIKIIRKRISLREVAEARFSTRVIIFCCRSSSSR
jgi:glutathione synthase/RimK-type ligase-like ATP-grasp enzyme